MVVLESLILAALLGSSVLVPEPWSSAALYILRLAPSAATLVLIRADATPAPPPTASPYPKKP